MPPASAPAAKPEARRTPLAHRLAMLCGGVAARSWPCEARQRARGLLAPRVAELHRPQAASRRSPGQCRAAAVQCGVGLRGCSRALAQTALEAAADLAGGDEVALEDAGAARGEEVTGCQRWRRASAWQARSPGRREQRQVAAGARSIGRRWCSAVSRCEALAQAALDRGVAAEVAREALGDEVVVEDLLAARAALRRRRAYAAADLLRDHLLERCGLSVVDHADGTSTTRLREDRADAALRGARARAWAREALEACAEVGDAEAARGAADGAARRVAAVLGPLAVLPGRQCADVALTLALAGAGHAAVFDSLAAALVAELRRQVPPPLVAAQVAERCAAAGYRQDTSPELFGAALDAMCGALESSSTRRDLAAGSMSLLSERPPLWRFA